MKRAVNQKLPNPEEQNRIIKELRREVEARRDGYRERALKLFPHVCGGCGREFSGRRLVELTVHHKDGNWQNNPPDGSNWELLCIYCHEYEHSKTLDENSSISRVREGAEMAPSIFNPFANLDALVDVEEDDEQPADAN